MPVRREGTLFALLFTAPVTSADVDTDKGRRRGAKCESTGAFPQVSYDGDPVQNRYAGLEPTGDLAFPTRPTATLPATAAPFQAVLENLATNRKIAIL
jgi:hypothetical protein